MSVVYVEVREDVYRVWIEYIPCRLVNITKIDIITALTILASALKGFRSILKLYGEVTIVEEMIGINRHGFVKVWLSKYFHCNRPHPEEV